MCLRVLVLEPYYGGSHRAFLDGWSAASRHRFSQATLPAHNWRWRMRHSALTFAQQLHAQPGGQAWDILWCTSMFDLAQFRGLAPATVRNLPAVVYFHENQLTYPVVAASPGERARDLHFAWTHLTSGAAADALWFNSRFHLEDFFAAADGLARRLPDPKPIEIVPRLRAKASVQTPGIAAPIDCRPGEREAALRIAWAARWEVEKGPATLFEALARLVDHDVPFRLRLLGQSFRRVPAAFADARRRFADHIDHWGYVDDAVDYLRLLASSDVFVSTAEHEFFGLSVVEAMAAGCHPLLPDRLSYPELLAPTTATIRQQVLYDGSADQLADRLSDLAVGRDDQLDAVGTACRDAAQRHLWPAAAARLDRALEALTGSSEAA